MGLESTKSSKLLGLTKLKDKLLNLNPLYNRKIRFYISERLTWDLTELLSENDPKSVARFLSSGLSFLINNQENKKIFSLYLESFFKPLALEDITKIQKKVYHLQKKNLAVYQEKGYNELVKDIERDIYRQMLLEKKVIAGVDEAGRGALAGPVIVAVVILPVGFQNPLIQDSKILSPSQRNRAYQIVRHEALEYNIIAKSAREIEEKNPLGATKEAMVEVVLGLKNKPNLCLVDGKEEIKIDKIKTISIVGGDRKSINIAAASIIAKVTRDTIMQKLHKNYPLYG
ncbi:6819_t:CDS:2 [Funneliformis geosporum]|uniref:Ribonuclease n=1 Tax=Funneliformis geosporum TaxID=1117311 RepID=A0A9W4WLF3_9GLOM|nr:6819_t:CDS:2 [Funneliformis geosporum]